MTTPYYYSSGVKEDMKRLGLSQQHAQIRNKPVRMTHQISAALYGMIN